MKFQKTSKVITYSAIYSTQSPNVRWRLKIMCSSKFPFHNLNYPSLSHLLLLCQVQIHISGQNVNCAHH